MKKRKSLSPIERFIAMPDAQKDGEVAEFENGIDPKDWRPLTPAQRRQWARIRSKGGRPKVGKGAKTVPVSIERDRETMKPDLPIGGRLRDHSPNQNAG